MIIDFERGAWIIGSGAVIILLIWATWRFLMLMWHRLADIPRSLVTRLADFLRSLKYLGGGSPWTLGAPSGIDVDWLAELLEKLVSEHGRPPEASRPVNVPIKGRIAFDAPDQMRQGKTITAFVRITRDMSLELHQLAAGLEPENTGIREIDVAPKMRVALRPEHEGDFTITSPSSPEQVIAASGYTAWRFRVRAERRGRRKLILCATMLLPDALDLEPWEHEIEVAVLPGYGAWRLARTHPGAAFSVIALPFVGLLFEISGAKDATQDLVEPRLRAFIGLSPKNEAASTKKPEQEAAPAVRMRPLPD